MTMFIKNYIIISTPWLSEQWIGIFTLIFTILGLVLTVLGIYATVVSLLREDIKTFNIFLKHLVNDFHKAKHFSSETYELAEKFKNIFDLYYSNKINRFLIWPIMIHNIRSTLPIHNKISTVDIKKLLNTNTFKKLDNNKYFIKELYEDMTILEKQYFSIKEALENYKGGLVSHKKNGEQNSTDRNKITKNIVESDKLEFLSDSYKYIAFFDRKTTYHLDLQKELDREELKLIEEEWLKKYNKKKTEYDKEWSEYRENLKKCSELIKKFGYDIS